MNQSVTAGGGPRRDPCNSEHARAPAGRAHRQDPQGSLRRSERRKALVVPAASPPSLPRKGCSATPDCLQVTPSSKEAPELWPTFERPQQQLDGSSEPSVLDDDTVKELISILGDRTDLDVLEPHLNSRAPPERCHICQAMTPTKFVIANYLGTDFDADGVFQLGNPLLDLFPAAYVEADDPMANDVL